MYFTAGSYCTATGRLLVYPQKTDFDITTGADNLSVCATAISPSVSYMENDNTLITHAKDIIDFFLSFCLRNTASDPSQSQPRFANHADPI